MPNTQSKTECKPFNHPKPLPPLSEKDITRFWKYVDKTPGQGPNGTCWGWLAGKDQDGYGIFSVKGLSLKAHRVGHLIQHGFDTFPNCTLHDCDFPPCIRKEHIKPGTHVENIKERTTKGRAARGSDHGRCLHPESSPRGDRNGTRTHPETLKRGDGHHARIHPETVLKGSEHGNAKLTEDQVIEIRRLIASGARRRDIAKNFEVSKSTIHGINQRTSWKHI